MQHRHSAPPVIARRLLTTTRAAALAACDPVTIRRAIAAGELEAVRLGEHGDYRIPPHALTAWLRPAQPEETA